MILAGTTTITHKLSDRYIAIHKEIKLIRSMRAKFPCELYRFGETGFPELSLRTEWKNLPKLNSFLAIAGQHCSLGEI
jgi:hypothetical protein